MDTEKQYVFDIILSSRRVSQVVLDNYILYMMLMKNSISQKRLLILIFACLFEGIITIVQLMLHPHQPAKGIILGYSLKRWGLIVGILLLQGIFILLAPTKKNKYLTGFIDKLLKSRITLVSLLLIFGTIISLAIFAFINNITALIQIYPVLIYGSLICLQLAIYQLFTFHNFEYHVEKVIGWIEKKNIIIWLTILIPVPLLFASAFKVEYPLGFAGLYTLMAEKIAEVNFHLPMSVPYYGPGGIPFAYPPLGFYLMAGFLKIGISAWDYLRWAPPILSWLAMAPLFLLAKRISNSKLGGMIAVLLASGSFYLYHFQTESGGIVRGLAFGLGLLSIYFLDRMVQSFQWRDAIFSGLFFGLAMLTHLGYAYFYAIWMGVWIITNPKKQNWLGISVVGMISAVISLPWISLMLKRYGWIVFTSAFQSHDNVQHLSMFQNFLNSFQVWTDNLQALFEKPLILLLTAAGLIILLVKKRFTLPLLFLLVSSIFFTGDRYVLTVAFLIIGYILSFSYHSFISNNQNKHLSLRKLTFLAVLTGMFVPTYISSLNQLSNQNPLIDQELVETALFVKNDTPTTANYLALVSDHFSFQSEEWLPYLSQRELVYAIWGSEWTGTYEAMNTDQENLVKCIDIQSSRCLEDWLLSTNYQPDYLIMDADLKVLSVSLAQSGEWIIVFSNQRYTVWEHFIGDPETNTQQ